MKSVMQASGAADRAVLAEGGSLFGGLSGDSLFIAIPAVMALFGLWTALAAARRLGRVRRLLRERAVDGRVVASHLRTRENANERTVSELIETVEFTPNGFGQPVRGTALASDHGMVDRSGMQVRVHHDRHDPQVFIAPVREGAFRWSGQLMHFGCGLGFTVLALLFGLFAMQFTRGF